MDMSMIELWGATATGIAPEGLAALGATLGGLSLLLARAIGAQGSDGPAHDSGCVEQSRGRWDGMAPVGTSAATGAARSRELAGGEPGWFDSEVHSRELARFSLTRVNRRDDPRDHLARLGLLVPALAEADAAEGA